MQKLNLTLLAVMLLGIFGLKAQVVTTEPAVLQESSQNIVIYYHADQGNKGLMNQPSSQPIYAHTGVITNKSTSASDWKHAPTWLDNAAKYKLSYVSANLWKLEIGNIRDYYGITDSSEKVRQLAFVFRNADGTRQGKTASGGDIFVDVVDQGLQVTLTSNLEGTLVTAGHENVSFTASCTQPATLTIDVNGTPVATQQNATKLSCQYNFTTPGEFTVTATATVNELTVTDRMVLTVPKSSPQQNYPGGTPKMGAVRQSDGSVLFCIAAPLKSSAIIVGSWNDYAVRDANTMFYQDYNGNRYFWIKVEGLNATDSYPYYYLVDGKAVGDPYAKLILDPNNDKYIPASVYPNLIPYPTDKIGADNVPLAVYKENINAYDWRVTNFRGAPKTRLNIYELLVRDFTGTEGKADGNGTINAAKAKIPYLKALGINAIELLPINEFNGNISWGYNPNFYFAPDKAYGTPDDYKAFIDECHAQGIAVILDMVFNQTDYMHPWYQLYSPGQNPFYNADAPHAYSVLNDWNQGNDLVQQQWTDALKYWMTAYNVDGFRFDLVKGLGDNDSYANGTESYNASRVNRMKRLHGVITSVKPDGIHINEDLAGAQEEKELGNDGQLQWANINEASRNFAQGSGTMNFMRFLSSSDGGRPWGSTVSYAESHDEQRMAFQAESYGTGDIKTDAAKRFRRLGTVAAQMLLIPGPKMVWQFGELGDNQNAKQNPNGSGGNNTDAKIVDWRWLDDPDRHALMETYSKIINARMDNPELFSRDATYVQRNLVSSTNGRTIKLNSGDKEIIGFFNPAVSGSMAITVESQQITPSSYTLIAASPDFAPVLGGTGNSLSVDVPAGCFAVYASSSVAGVEDVVGGTTVTVSGGNGCINIAGDYTNAAAYDLSGRLMPSLSVPAGLYIVVVDGTATKVLVK